LDLYLLWVAFLLGIVEGVTEFIPVSSTGHLILAAELLNFNDESSKVFEIFIQLGAILAVMVEYKKKLIQTFKGALHEKVSQNFIVHLFIAFLPAAIMGLLFHKMIKIYLFNPIIVGISLVIGGFIMILIEKKLTHKITKDWSNPKFMSFLYAKYIRKDLNISPAIVLKKPRIKARRRVNFEDILDNQSAIGKKSELFAIEWEKNRLIGLGYKELVKKIEDRRDIPSYGYDYLSFSKPEHERYIEVKSIGRDKKGKFFRFFLSENELSVSKSDEHCKDYYFYLVRYGKDGNPCDVLVREAKEFYSNSEMSPCAYVVKFDIEE